METEGANEVTLRTVHFYKFYYEMSGDDMAGGDDELGLEEG